MPQTTLNLNQLSEAPFNRQVSTLRKLFGFSQKDFAKVLSVPEQTIKSWEQGKEETVPQAAHKQAVDSLHTIVESLNDLFEPNMIEIWVNSPNPALHGERPRDFAKKPGGIFLMGHLLKNLSR